MKEVIIRGNIYNVAKNEFIASDKYRPIVTYNKLSEFDKEIFLLKSISKLNEDFEFVNYGDSHDSYVFKNAGKWFDASFESTKLTPFHVFSNKKVIVRVDPKLELSIDYVPVMILCDDAGDINEYTKYVINSVRMLYVHKNLNDNYSCYLRIKDGVILLDNLIHITFMIKNSGDIIRTVLLENLKIADQMTILDTGSTDNTLDIVYEIAAKEPNRIKIYQEPFIDFSTSRNRLMDLAEEEKRKCVFHIMLDDTYVLRNSKSLREFLDEIRSDEYQSFSINIKGMDIIYSSNRIIRPESKLRYKYKIHEALNSNAKESALIPTEKGYIEDLQSDYMRDRTLKRKDNDLKLLFEELEKNPKDPRIYYYIAETYLCMEDYPNASKYYSKRSNMDGYSEETYDSMYKKVVIDHIHLDAPWADVQQGYLECYKFDPERPESIFMIGYEYYNRQVLNLAHMFLKKAFEIGIPINQNMNIKIEQACYNLPNFLINTCYQYKDYKLGIEACYRLLDYDNKDRFANYWLSVFTMLKKANDVKIEHQKHPVNKEKILFVSDGGWDHWDGETLYKNGIGGSETFTIKYAEWLQKNEKYNVVVCCKCKENKVWNGVNYIKIEDCAEYVKSNFVKYAIVNRYSSYVVLLENLGVQNIYFVAHDIAIPGDIIPVLPSLKGILCISEWAKEQFCSTHQSIPRSLFSVISYGIDVDKFPRHSIRKYSFIYSSFANRGLLELLKMFPRIVQKYPSAVLNVFCDLDNTWLVEHYPSQLQQIKILLEQHKDFVINYGWVNQRVLNNFWSTSHVWLYPCTFAETCCLTAYEAAASRTLAISNDLGALKENVNVLVEGNPEEETWKDRALDRLFEILDDEDLYKNLITQNYTWVLKEKNFPRVVRDFTSDFLSEKLNSNF